VLEHQDSLGHVEQLRAGELQRMTAGSGIQHSEYNPSPTEVVHLYQIWIQPRQDGLAPEYEQRQFDPEARQGVFQLVASGDGRDGAMVIHQDTNVYLGRTNANHRLRHALDGRDAWLQVVSGTLDAGPDRLQAGDGMATDEPLDLHSGDVAEVMLFEFNKN
jgi:redox-sensitive bicupin YhaK (pirin superfamily)